MNPYQAPESESKVRLVRRTVPTHFFAKLFAVTAFLLVGGFVFYKGYCAFNPPPPPPGCANCGNAVLGGLLAMVFIAPVAAIACSWAAAQLGGIVDLVLDRIQSHSDVQSSSPEPDREGN
jgi:hypothetical protein